MLNIIERDNYILVPGSDFSPVHTFECGQCFRFEQDIDGAYLGVAFGRPLRLWASPEGLCLDTSAEDFFGIWAGFLDLERDYASISAAFPRDPFTAAAIDFGRGLRILRQQPWEALCSFIISQCNNISRIKAIISRLCQKYGKPIDWRGQTMYSFPPPQAFAGLQADELDFLRAGYRAKYIISAARAIADGQVDFDALAAMPSPQARAEIMLLEGVGGKVADCFLLFGLGKLDAFPVDTWMKKAEAFYPGGFPAQSFGAYGGVAQQYIFYYARSNKIEKAIDKPRA